MKLLKIGKIVNTFGIKGELKVLSESEFIEDRFRVKETVYLEDGTALVISSFREHKGNVLIKVNDSNDINEIEYLKNKDLYIDQNDLPTLEDDYYLFELEDLNVYVDDEHVGQVIEVFKPAQTLLRIKLEDREILLPFVDAFVKSVSLKDKRIDVNLIEGL